MTTPRLALKKSEAAEAAGLSVRTIDRAIARGELRSVLVGRSRRILATDLERFLREHAA